MSRTRAIRRRRYEHRDSRSPCQLALQLFRAVCIRGPREIRHVLKMLKMREVHINMGSTIARGNEAASDIAEIVAQPVRSLRTE
jgi:hypothetical protein